MSDLPKNSIEAARLAGNAYGHALRHVYMAINAVKADSSITVEQKRRTLASLYSRLSWRDIKSSFAQELVRKRIGVSFRSSISHLRFVKDGAKKYGYVIAPGGNPKMGDRAFAQSLGVPTPVTIATGLSVFDIDPEPNTVIKPVSGAASKGVFLIDSDLSAYSVHSGRHYTTFHEGIEGEYKGTRLERAANWMVETRIGNADSAARDLKVFCFYGKSALVEEIHRNAHSSGKNTYCFYYPSGEAVRVDPARPWVEGEGFPPQLLEYAERISSNTPVPFLRVDFIESNGQLVLGEITPHPGGTYSGQLHDYIDQELGEHFLDAEARLFVDLLEGRSFETYFSSYPDSRKLKPR